MSGSYLDGYRAARKDVLRRLAKLIRDLRNERDRLADENADLRAAFTSARAEIKDEEERGAKLVAEVDSLRERLAAVREWCDDSQVWAVSGSYLDGYRAARKDVLRRLDRGEVA